MALRIQIQITSANRTAQYEATVSYRYRVVDEADAVVVPFQGPFTTQVLASSLASYRDALTQHAIEQERARRKGAIVWSTPPALSAAFEAAIEDDAPPTDPIGA